MSELGATAAFRTGTDNQDATAVPHDVGGRRNAFHTLGVGEVQGISGTCRDDRVHRRWQSLQQDLCNELDPGLVRGYRIPGEDLGDTTIPSQRHVQHEAVTRHGGDFGQFAMQGIVDNRPFHRTRFPHEFRAVQNLNGLLRGEARGHQFAASREARHQMGFYEAEGNSQVRRGEAPVNVDRRSGLRAPQMLVALEIPRFVVLYPIL